MENTEIERKYKITKNIYDEVTELLNNKNLNFKLEKQNDIYFSPTNFPFFGGEIDNEALRIRILDDKNILSYKKFYYATYDMPAHCDEHEMVIEDVEKMKLILKDLRINEAFTLKKTRKTYIYENIEIALDKVEDLGYFIEFELLDSSNLEKSSKIMDELLKEFKITEDMRNYDGYAYLLFNKNNIANF